VTPRVRPVRRSDLDALVALEAVFPTDRLERRSFLHAIASPTIDCLVISEEGRVAGYGMVHRRTGSRVARLTSIAVEAASAGRGLGGALLGALERTARRRGCHRLRLEVRADNVRAQRLYAGRGYRRFETMPAYYEDGEAALRFEKVLS
jgi:ribosomal protein S18 acetylase RimI-like enzyme